MHPRKKRTLKSVPNIGAVTGILLLCNSEHKAPNKSDFGCDVLKCKADTAIATTAAPEFLVWLSINRTPAMMPLAAPLLGPYYLEGHISLKKWTYYPLLRESATPFKSTCSLIKLTGFKL
jgi:hypothetical protein